MRNKLFYIPLFIGGAFLGLLLFYSFFLLVGPDGKGPAERLPGIYYPVYFLAFPSFSMGPVSAFLFHGFQRDLSGDIVGFHVIGCLVVLYGFYACLLGYLVYTRKGWIRTTLTLLATHLLLSGVFFGLATLLNLRP